MAAVAAAAVVVVAVGHYEHSFVFGQYFVTYMTELPHI